jgi:hypothetical protein
VIAALVWIFVALHLLLLEGWLYVHGWPRVDASACACLFAGLFARPGCLPAVLLGMALARAALLGGDTALHFLILGIPAAVLVPLRRLFSRTNALWQAFCAAALAFALPRLTLGLATVFAQQVPCAAATLGGVALAAVAVPALTALLRILPPLSRLAEAHE